uniref:HDIG domain-containing protein n=1 Tax=candidate division WOR-3 bacterium TaxID=2052148 RepID=A0A7C4TAI8_UNCW3
MKIKIQHRYLCLSGIIVLLNILFHPPLAPKRYKIKEGEIANLDIIAPYDFPIPKTENELLQERKEIAQRIPPVYNLDSEIPQKVSRMIIGINALIDSLRRKGLPSDSILFSVQREYPIPASSVEFLLKQDYNRLLKKIGRDIEGLYRKGIIEKKEKPHKIITISSGEKEIIVSDDELFSITEAESILMKGQPKELQRLLGVLVIPNVLYDELKTQRRIDEVFANVPKTKGMVLRGEIIVEKHKRVTPEAIEKISALEKTYKISRGWEFLKLIFFQNLFYLSIFLFLIYFNTVHKLNLFQTRNLYYITTLMVIYLIILKIIYETNLVYLLPIAFFTILFSLYFNFYVAFVFTTVLSILSGLIFNSLGLMLYLFASGITALFSSQSLKTRFSLYRPMFYIAISNIVAIIFIEVYLLKEGIRFFALGAGLLNALFSGVAVALLLPLFEKLFDFTTDLTLLELMNLNLPIFKEMAINAPGTYHHSVVVGNLAEAGASAIGADPILARAGAYYHDIGKLKKPEYFIENQIGQKNPHDNLKPRVSALVIISHVKDGIEMAKAMKLPKKLISIIAEHHGTSRIETFYRKALNTTEGISEDAFSYPGPKPKTKEAALVMLADSVEATARAEKNITTAKLQKILKENFDKKFSDGQLDECPLNRFDLEQIKVAFLPILMGVFHPRLEYEEKSEKN